MNAFAARYGNGLVLLAGLVLIIAACFSADGLFNIDELIYYLGAESFARTGSLLVENGYQTYASPDLQVWFLAAGPHGLTPQYPAGTAVLGGLFVKVLGVRGLMVLNALAAAGVLWLTHRLSLRLYDSPTVALIAVVILVCGSFFVEYALGVWPHMIATFFVVLALLLAVRAAEQSARQAFWPAVLSGLAIGAGLLFRADVILILPPIAALLVLFAVAPVRAMLGGMVGLVPGATLSAWANAFKFGTWNPLSYGVSDSNAGVNLASHLTAGAAMLIVFAMLVAARYMTWDRRMRLPIAVLALAGVAACVYVPPLNALAMRYLTGFRALALDMTLVHDSRPGIEYLPNGLVSFWGLAKKSLVQSLPWLGILGLLILRPWPEEHRRGHLVLLLSVGLFTLPFMLQSWHGGFGSNMRYFLPAVPMLAILVAAIAAELAATEGVPPRIAAVGALLGIALGLAWISFAPTGGGGAQQILPLYAFGALGLMSLPAAVPKLSASAMARALQLGLAACIGIGAVEGLYIDLRVSQDRRQVVASMSELLAGYDRPNLFYGQMDFFAFQAGRPDGLIAASDRLSGAVDVALLRNVLADGYFVFLAGSEAPLILEQAPDLAIGRVFETPQGFVQEIVRR